jgi:hypothetical protein
MKLGQSAGAVRVALIGVGIGLFIAAAQSYAARGDISLWVWVLIPPLVAGVFLWLGGHFDQSNG